MKTCVSAKTERKTIATTRGGSSEAHQFLDHVPEISLVLHMCVDIFERLVEDVGNLVASDVVASAPNDFEESLNANHGLSVPLRPTDDGFDGIFDDAPFKWRLGRSRAGGGVSRVARGTGHRVSQLIGSRVSEIWR